MPSITVPPRAASAPHPPTPRPPSLQVYRAICKPYQEEVAVKLLDLENMNCSLDEIVREAQVGALGWQLALDPAGRGASSPPPGMQAWHAGLCTPLSCAWTCMYELVTQP